MKQTNIPWIAEIPENWRLLKVKQAFNIVKEKAKDKKPVVLSLARDGIKIRDISTNEGQLADNYEDYNPVKIGDLLLNPMDLYSGANCNVSEVEGVISPAYSKLRAKIYLNPKFFDYYFKTQYWTMAMFAHGKGVSFDNRWTLNNDSLKLYEIPFPSIEEQNNIVNSIKKKEVKINALIKNEEHQIEKIKIYKQSLISEVVTKGLNTKNNFKNSNILFLTKIPENWSELSFQRICSKISDYVASGSFKSLADNVKYLDFPDYAMLIRTADLSGKSNTSGKVYVNKHAYDFLNNSNLFGGEIILPNIGASVGDVYIVPKMYDRMTLGPNSIFFKTKFNDKYFYYYFFSKFGRENLINLSESTAQPKFNKTKLRSLLVPVPPLKEQDEIVCYLDSFVKNLDKLITNHLRKIEFLKKYRQSMIYEYVTGKKEV